ncbi:carbohydrate-binding protein [Agrobacterium tumefaciens]|uniref:Discoidin domain-containing protein n=1 Tax=Agrobacterium tumefaciens TaxID=358 RepID=A0AA44F5E5_AGRTU|nr:carbohydrate-binding protein [Agrobacterium tumefaciens]NTB87531.1 discoidin domain-containing protein [Agrobacterium tumefaciens]NTC17516.1 discoidin domain-containing protein [Agrobacterium tumefaciens]NTC29702.1 discoidin domain-containing protein [Agrobacterium tumefaciens]
MELTLKVVDAHGTVKAAATSVDETFLVYREAYQVGDQVVIEASEAGHLVLALDDAIGASLVYMAGEAYALPVPFGARRVPYSPSAFDGAIHRLYVRKARLEEFGSRRNLALNPWDDHGNSTVFPHAKANVETRGEAVFAARNAIDGEKANDDHGFWPYTSWGINQNPDATLTLDFGRPVQIDEIVFYLRADFPHDAWWEEASVTFSYGKTSSFALVKSGAAQCFGIEPRTVEWISVHSLIKAEDPSPFPALTQIEVWGQEVD